jgi:hypothetical protein
MLDIVAPHQHQPPAAIDGGGIDHRQPRHPSAIGIGAEAIAREAADQPGGGADQGQNDHECEEEYDWLWHCLVPGKWRFFVFSESSDATRTIHKTANKAYVLP